MFVGGGRKDQKVYTFTLRKNVKWSDGTPLKAQDFVEGWKRLLTPATGAPYAYLLYDVVGAEDSAVESATVGSDFDSLDVTSMMTGLDFAAESALSVAVDALS